MLGQVRNVLDILTQATGLEQAVTPRSFWHFLATKVLDKTGDLKVSDKRLREAHRVVFEKWGWAGRGLAGLGRTPRPCPAGLSRSSSAMLCQYGW